MDFNAQSAQLKIEEQKFARLALTFLYKAMEAIYSLRCPNQVEFIQEDSNSNWFNLNIPRSNELRQHLQSSFYHGWFNIDISLSDTKQIVERWYLIHIPAKQTETLPSLAVSMGGSGISSGTRNSALKELKIHTYRRFTQILRSIYSMIGMFPATTLSTILSQLKTRNKTHLVANLSNFQKFPAQITSFCEEETAKFRFGPIYTPIGQAVVICHYRIDIQPLIPIPFTVAYNPFPIKKDDDIDLSQYDVINLPKEPSSGMDYDAILKKAVSVTANVNQILSNTNDLHSSSTFHLVRPISADPIVAQTSARINDTYGTSIPSVTNSMTPSSHVDIMSFMPDALGQFEPLDLSKNRTDTVNHENSSAENMNTMNSIHQNGNLPPIDDFIDYLKGCKNQKCSVCQTFQETVQQLMRVKNEISLLKVE